VNALPGRPALRQAIEDTWLELAGPGAHLDGEERVALAAAARAFRAGLPISAAPLSAADLEAVEKLTLASGTTTGEWVPRICDQIGELRYIELVGVVARVTAVDTFFRLTGADQLPLPTPRPGGPSNEAVPDGAKLNRTWVRMVKPTPPAVLGAVPSAMYAMVALTDELYMPEEEMVDPDWRRGDLHRTQVELVAASASHVNECFY
jgi:hypothetical protein